MNSSEIELATFRLVAQCLNQLQNAKRTPFRMSAKCAVQIYTLLRFVRAFVHMRKGACVDAIAKFALRGKIPRHNSVCTNQFQALNASIHEFRALVEFNPNLWPRVSNIWPVERLRPVTDKNSVERSKVHTHEALIEISEKI
jgi:hypothetical protein